MSGYQTPSGSRVSIGTEVGKGGEGTVYAVAGSPDLVAKIYTDGRAEDRRNKIEAMVSAGLHRQAAHISFPIEVLLDEKRRFVGFTMRKVKDALPIHQLWNSRDRQEKFPDATVAFMVRVAANVARAVAELHHTGCVIGDINESGFLVTKQATVILIDSDSIQYSSGSHVFPCVVGTPEYLPPEHQGINQRSLGPRDPNHDNFGTAVMIFRLLMSGTHPFGGIWKGRGDPPSRPKWIEEFRYAYGAERHRLNVEPQPSAPPVDWLSEEIRSGFDRAFGRSGVQQRPSANDWIQMLDQFEGNLAQCRNSPFHQHRQNANRCPWCETEQKRKTELFGKPKPSFQQKPFAQSTTAGRPSSSRFGQTSKPSPSPAPRPSSSPMPKAVKSSNRNAFIGVAAVGIAILLFGKPVLEAIEQRQIAQEQRRNEEARVASISAEVWASNSNSNSRSTTFSANTEQITFNATLTGIVQPSDNFRMTLRYPNGEIKECHAQTCFAHKYQIRIMHFFSPLSGQKDRVEIAYPAGTYTITASISDRVLATSRFSVTR